MKKRNVLSAADRFKLWQFVEKNYVSMGMPDAKFAVYAGGELKFDVSESHICHARQGLNIQSFQPKRSDGILAERVTKLENVVRAMRIELGMEVHP